MAEETWTQNWSLGVSLFAFVHSFTQQASADLLQTALGTKCPPPCPQVAESLPSLSLRRALCGALVFMAQLRKQREGPPPARAAVDVPGQREKQTKVTW